MGKNKSKKDKKPNIPAQTLVRPRLEQIIARFAERELDEDEYVSSIEHLMAEVGRQAVLNALLGLLDQASNEQKNALMVAIPKLGNAETIKYLWQLVQRSKASIASKMTALVILSQMGEKVNLEDPGQYFSWRDVKHADIAEVENLAHFGMRALIKEVQRAEDTDDLENMMLQMERIHAKAGGEPVALAEIESLIEMADSGAADMLLAITATTPRPKVREAARKGLLKLAGQKVFPQSEIIKSLTNERFHSAYSTDPSHPWQQGVIIAFERSPNNIQALIFLLDFGYPWQGAIKDVFPTRMMTPQQLHREFIKRSKDTEAEYRLVTYGRARQFILEALKANQRNRIKLPKEFEEFRHLMERRIVDPSAEVLAYATQVDAKTVDEWGELSGQPLRGMEVLGLDGKPVIFMGGPDEDKLLEVLKDMAVDEPGEDDEYDEFDDLLLEIEEYYFDEDEEEPTTDEDFLIPYDWTVDYLTTRYNQGIDPDELDDRWMDLADFMYYANISEQPPTELTEVQGFHLSEFVTIFWDAEIDEESPVEERQHTLETIQDLYTFLAAERHVPDKVTQRVKQAVATLLSQPGQLTPIDK
jgi:hypothetical protein